jgi:hydrogenase nickel incorporation protein HypA/HybF
LHEFALAQELLKIIEAEAKGLGATRVERAKLKVGKLSMITVDSIRSTFEIVSKGSITEGAQIDVEEEEPQITCGDCGSHITSGAELVCPSCKGTRLEISGGTDVSVVSISIGGRGDKDI